MDWIQYVLLLLVAVFIYSRFAPVKGLKNITATTLKEKMSNKEKIQIVDVREPHEFKAGHIKQAINIPLGRIPYAANKELIKENEIVLVCLSGSRSKAAARKLQKQGYTNLNNLVGGMNAWN